MFVLLLRTRLEFANLLTYGPVPKLGGLSLSRSASRPLKRSLKESTGNAGSDDDDEEYEDEYYDEVRTAQSLLSSCVNVSLISV